MPITEDETNRVNEIAQIASFGRLAAVETTNKETGERVVLLGTAVFANGRVDFLPFGEMITGDIFEKYNAPEGLNATVTPKRGKDNERPISDAPDGTGSERQ